MGLEAYRKVQKAAESPRTAEYRLFGQVTSALIKARDQQLEGRALMDSLDWNRRLWTTLSTDCAMPDNAMPKDLRAQIISLALWVNRYTSEVATGKSGIDALIDVNKAIMEGLGARAAAAPAA